MSTRCNITIVKEEKGILTFPEFPNVQIYHHYDGYPEGVGEMLKDWARSYTGGLTIEDVVESVKNLDDEMEVENHRNLHGDIEYHYLIIVKDDALVIECRSIDWGKMQSHIDSGSWTRCEIVGDKGFKVIFAETYHIHEQPSLQDILGVATDKELFAELKRRGYAGNISKTITITL